MPTFAWIDEAFPISWEPFTLPEVIRRLRELYSPDVTKDVVYQAVRTLKDSPVTAPLVVPLDGGRPAFYSAESARRIAQRVCAQNAAKTPNFANSATPKPGKR